MTNEEKRKAAKEKFDRAHSKTFGGQSISSSGLCELRKTGKKVVVVDVRTEAERKVSRISGSIDEDEFWKMDVKSMQKDTHVVGYCTIGFRSGMFAQKVKNKGIENVYNSEGVVLWTHDRKTEPLIRRDERGNEQPTKEVHVYGSDWDLADEGYKTFKFSTFENVTVGVAGTIGSTLRRWFQ
mmetsp:Transcript_10591/g.25890  ORF Transcript_10591/g.25890 Transcript_10591/m.25890 type:complete len:182 (+) Transcript_10591:134-679(+)